MRTDKTIIYNQRTRFFQRHFSFPPKLYPYLCPSSQNATALAAATFNESTPWDIGIFTVSGAGASLNGILMIKVEPMPSSLLTSIVPPIFSIRPFTIAIPSPIPCCVLLASSLSCENGSNICSWYSLLIPMPVSVMVHSYVVIPSTVSLIVLPPQPERGYILF